MLTVIVGFDCIGEEQDPQAVGQPVLGDAFDRRDALDAARQVLRGRLWSGRRRLSMHERGGQDGEQARKENGRKAVREFHRYSPCEESSLPQALVFRLPSLGTPAGGCKLRLPRRPHYVAGGLYVNL